MDKDLVTAGLDQHETIKLMRMSRGYQWEIKLFVTDDVEEKLAKFDKNLRKRYIEEEDPEYVPED